MSSQVALTPSDHFGYGIRAAAKSVAGIGIPQYRRAQALTRRAFFVSTALWWAVWGFLREGRFSCSGNANSVQPATLLIGINGGGSQYIQEGTAMSKHTQVTSEDLRHAGSPEDYFLIPPQAPKEINADVLLATLARARAVLMFIETAGQDLEEGFHVHPVTLMEALGCVGGLIEQAQMIARHPFDYEGHDVGNSQMDQGGQENV
ncbi:MAG: hypothetical protein JMN24_05160 [gamma proteobacterium endosymbiont of Lamellibrachia anaximandri]|nr:hypothetical protein [gamma proteobacterium endosymbiont of Lamellibrachia anaximandri]MBL3616227.1 hypothetical protein [gamma proteobacterium endosymbiont of Lamellibrachia anaximandri]